MERTIDQTSACLICGEPWTRERLADYTVLVVGGESDDSFSVEHAWLCHLECLRIAAHPRFADRFARP